MTSKYDESDLKYRIVSWLQVRSSSLPSLSAIDTSTHYKIYSADRMRFFNNEWSSALSDSFIAVL